jgi:hypothetical protein
VISGEALCQSWVLLGPDFGRCRTIAVRYLDDRYHLPIEGADESIRAMNFRGANARLLKVHDVAEHFKPDFHPSAHSAHSTLVQPHTLTLI